jgi:hypothetical protein
MSFVDDDDDDDDEDDDEVFVVSNGGVDEVDDIRFCIDGGELCCVECLLVVLYALDLLNMLIKL